MMFFKKIYNNSPIFMQHLLTTLKGYQLKARRYNKIYYKELSYFENISNVSSEQELQINKLLIHLKYNVPYYKKILKDIPDLDLKEDILLALPIIEKEDLRSNINDHINIREKNIFVTKTGGTTGKSLNVYSNNSDIAKRMAYLDFFKQQHGVKHFSRRASFTGQEIIPYNQNKNIYWRYNHSIKQMLYSAFRINEENLKYYINSLNRFQPKTIDGFPTSIYSLAKYINLNNIRLTFRPIAIFPTAETLLDHHKKEIEKAFNCPVRNQYASSEGAPFITECINGKLHMNIETGYFNLEEYDPINNLYNLIVTSFLNFTTPIVQYRIGDIVEYHKEQKPCTCGNKSPYVTKILGRQTDYLLSSKSGKVTSANMSNVVKNLPNSIIASQFIQKKINEIIVNLVIDKSIYKDSDSIKITESLKYRFGENIKVEINYVNEIEKEASGKTMFIKNLIN